MNRIVIALLLSCLLWSCTMAPKYTRPEAPVPSDWPDGPAYRKTAGTVAPRIEWQDFIQSEQVQKVIELALANNRDLRVSALNIERARALYRIQRARLFPEVDASGTFSKERVPGILSRTGQPLTTELYNVNLGITAWEIDFFGRIRSLKDQALELYLASEQARRSAQTALIAEVANACLTLASDRENLKLARSTLEAQEATYKVIRRRYEVGASSELDLRQAQTRVETARADIARYTGLIAMDENAINLLAGSQAAGLLPGELEKVAVLQDFSAGLPSEVLLNRPDILQSENLLKAANANIGAARANFFPRISLTTSIGTTSDALGGLFKSGSETWSFVPQILLPIFDAGSRWYDLQAAKAERDIAVAQYEGAIQTAFREVADALAQRGTIDDQLRAQQDLVFASAEAYRLSSLRYEKGIDTYLSVLDSQRSLYASQQVLISLRLAKLANLVNLYKALGGGS